MQTYSKDQHGWTGLMVTQEKTASHGVRIVQIAAWLQYRWLRHGFSTRSGGRSTVYTPPGATVCSLNLGFTREDEAALVLENRSLFLEGVAGVPSQAAVTLRQVHGTDIHDLDDLGEFHTTAEGRAVFEGDGLMTDRVGAYLGIQTADCVPVLLVDPVRRAVAVLHAGWRGTAAAMAEEGVHRMTAEYGSRPEELLAAVGPSIGPCCYTVGDEVKTAFAERFSYNASLFEGDFLNLWRANEQQLVTAGLSADNIFTVGECTGCSVDADGRRRYFSHRIDRGNTGRMMSVAGLMADS